MFSDVTYLDPVLRGLILPAVGLAWVILLIRVNGLRSLSKMTNFDFVMTVALGSLLAGFSQATDWSGAVQPALAMAALFAAQFSAAWIRQRSDTVEMLLANKPEILMRDGTVFDAALKRTRVSRSDLISKLREANVLEPERVRAVVLEETGDVSVLHGDRLDETLLEGTRTPDQAVTARSRPNCP